MNDQENINNEGRPGDASEENQVMDATSEAAAEVNAAPMTAEIDINSLIEAAEIRGYYRAVKEREAAQSQTNSDDDPMSDDSCPGFLAHLRPSFWDR